MSTAPKPAHNLDARTERSPSAIRAGAYSSGGHRGADGLGKILAGRVACPEIWRRSPGLRFDAGLSRLRHRHRQSQQPTSAKAFRITCSIWWTRHFPFTAGEYRLRAIAVLEDLRQRSRLPILTVGTGLYLRALLEGLGRCPGALGGIARAPGIARGRAQLAIPAPRAAASGSRGRRAHRVRAIAPR